MCASNEEKKTERKKATFGKEKSNIMICVWTKKKE